MEFFFYGTLCHAPLRRVVFGRDVAAEPAVLPDQAVHWAEGQSFPVIRAETGAEAVGVLLRGLTEADVARFDFYGGGFGCTWRDLTVRARGGDSVARVYFAEKQRWQAGAPWVLADWQALFGASVVATAGDVMALYGKVDPGSVRARYGQMMVRGSSRVRAASAGPVTRRFAAGSGDVAVADLRQPYAHFFAVEEYDLAYRRFDGSQSPVVTRAVFVSGDAVTVLPYDPVRDRVLLIEQFRVGPHARGDGQPWLLEAIAGRIDPGERPEDCARREAVEEAGLVLDALLPVAQYYPSPGAVSEYLYSYVALVDLPDGVEGVFGVEGEAEDIRGHLVGFDDFIGLVARGEVANAPLILTALWLQRERGRLRG